MGTRKVGLLGGSFNPAHEGHLHISQIAKTRLDLDEVWWLVSPQNPLKLPDATPDLSMRLDYARQVASSSRYVCVMAPEAYLGTAYTIDLTRWLRRRYAHGRFVWIMGADNLAAFHLWKGWRDIARLLPIAVIDRPGYRHAANASRAARALARWRWPENDAPGLVDARPPAWVFLRGPLSHVSSTAIRSFA